MRARITSVGLILPPPAAAIDSPDHIDRASLAALPSKPGVYVFRDPAGAPLYIGKSINIRARVLAHLRTPHEAALLGDTHRIDFVRTAGDIGALLLESHMIKRLQPPYNVLLKFPAESFALCMQGDEALGGKMRVQIVGHSDAYCDDERLPVFGLFASRSAAQEGLEALVRRHALCPALLGLESASQGRACFAHQIGRCRGACIGIEARAAHFMRLRQALAELDAAAWPFPGPIGIVETDQRWRQIHVVHRWSYLGALEGRQRTIQLPANPPIDIDTYKILARPLADGTLTVAPLVHTRGRNYRAVLPD